MKQKEINILQKVKKWFNYKKYPDSHLEVGELMKSIFSLLILLLVFIFMVIFILSDVWGNCVGIITYASRLYIKIIHIFLFIFFLSLLFYIFEQSEQIFINLKEGFRGLKKGYKLIIVVLLLLLIFYGWQSCEIYFSAAADTRDLNNLFNCSYHDSVPYNNVDSIANITNSTISSFLGYIINYSGEEKLESFSEDINLKPTPTKEELESNPKYISLKYVVRGKVDYINFTVYKGLKDYLAEIPRTYYCIPICPTDGGLELRYPNQKEQDKYLKKLVDIIKSKTNNSDDQARIAISLVQNIPYDEEGYRTNNLSNRYPYEVLYDEKGVCGEKSKLLAYILRELGFGVILFSFEVENHMAVGIKCPSQYTYKNTSYCFVESTTSTIPTNSESDYGEHGEIGKLKSTPELIDICDGISFNSISEEYKDAQEWIKLDELSERSHGYLGRYYYNRWLYLAKKYGIEVTNSKKSTTEVTNSEENTAQVTNSNESMTQIIRSNEDSANCSQNTIYCNGKCWEKCLVGYTFYCTSSGGICQ